MKAAVVDRYCAPEGVAVREVPEPVARPRDLLVRVNAAAVTRGDARIRSGRFPKGMGPIAKLALGLRGPRRPVLGICFAGVVEQADNAGRFAVGDAVAGMSGATFGAHAEFMAVSADRAVPIPDGVNHEEAAAALFGGSSALFFLHDLARIRSGMSVLVNGASGAVGTSAVQFAHRAGAVVTGVTSAKNADFVTSLGASEVVDYQQQPVHALGDRFDIVIDTVGNLDPADARRLLMGTGVAVLAAADLPQTLRARGQVRAGTAKELPEHFAATLNGLADGWLSPVVQATLPLADIADAYRIVDSGRKAGNVVVTL